MPESNPSIRLTSAGGIARITLNRPQRGNALTVPMMRRLLAALAAAEDDRLVRCVVLDAIGRDFCAGLEWTVLSKWREHHDPAGIGELLRVEYHPVIARIHDLSKPVMASIQGQAAGAGLSLALACDLRIAARAARFVPASREWDRVPAMGASAGLVRILGYAKALEFALVRDELSADDALAMGLVGAVVERDELEGKTQAWARRIAEHPLAVVEQTKRLLRDAARRTWDAQLRAECWAQSCAAGAAGLAAQQRADPGLPN